MRIILLGAPGAGKGTHADFISSKLGLVKISSGDMLRQAVANKDEIGQKIAAILQQGGFVDEDIVINLILNKLKSLPQSDNFLLDGFPRTIKQAEVLQQNQIFIDKVIYLDVADKEIINRLSGRRIHPSSGRVYHTIFNPPKVADLDDITHEPLLQRSDDKPEVIAKRLQLFHQETAPLLKWYQEHNVNCIRINGVGEIEKVRKLIAQQLGI